MPGKYFDDLSPGDRFTSPTRTVNEGDTALFTSLTGLLNPLFTDEEFARGQGFGSRLVPGPLTVALALGLTDELGHGTVAAALGIDRVRFVAPVRPGDTIRVETTILKKRESASRPDRGPISLNHKVRNQRGEVVCTFERTLMFLKRPLG